VEFAKLVRARQLNTREIVVEWLETHTCVSALQLAVETDFYYPDGSFRMVIWRMVHAGELEPIRERKIYKRAAIRPQRAKIDDELREEIGMVATAMPIEEVMKLYQVSHSTVVRANRELRKNRPELAAEVAHKKRQEQGRRYGINSSYRDWPIQAKSTKRAKRAARVLGGS